MQIDQVYNFLFHPLHEDFSDDTSQASLIVNVTLLFFTIGIYALIFGFVHLAEWTFSIRAPSSSDEDRRIATLRNNLLMIRNIPPASPANLNRNKAPSPSIGSIAPPPSPISLEEDASPSSPKKSFVGIEALKEKQKDHLEKLQKLAEEEKWEHLATHTSHPDSGFDWWMFPIDRKSSGHGECYQVPKDLFEELANDEEFIQNFRRGVILVGKSWGWDIEQGRTLLDKTDNQKWRKWSVRLGKIAHSLKLLKQEDLLVNLEKIIREEDLFSSLPKWVQKHISSREIE